MALKEVTRDEFLAKVGPMNVHPRAECDASYWETPSRVLVGKTLPGYRDAGLPGYPKRYFLAAS